MMLSHTQFPHIPIDRPHPDVRRLIRVLLGQERTPQPPMVEFLIDPFVRQSIVTGLLGRDWVDDPQGDRRASTAYWDNYIACWHQLGYDYVRLEADLLLPIHTADSPDGTAGSQQIRHWRHRHRGVIGSWEDFERYPWPRVEEHDFFPFEYINAHLPDGRFLMAISGEDYPVIVPDENDFYQLVIRNGRPSFRRAPGSMNLKLRFKLLLARFLKCV